MAPRPVPRPAQILTGPKEAMPDATTMPSHIWWFTDGSVDSNDDGVLWRLKTVSGTQTWVAGPPLPGSYHVVGGTGEIAYQNSWAASTGGGLRGLRYRKWGNRVFLQGAIAGGTSGTVVCTLPTGYRPPALEIGPCVVNGGTGYFQIATTGALTVTQLTGSASGGTYLSGCSWSID